MREAFADPPLFAVPSSLAGCSLFGFFYLLIMYVLFEKRRNQLAGMNWFPFIVGIWQNRFEEGDISSVFLHYQNSKHQLTEDLMITHKGRSTHSLNPTLA